MLAENWSPYAKRIVESSLEKIKSEDIADSMIKMKGAVRSVVSDVSVEVGPDNWDGTINSALLEIVQSYIGQLAKEH